MLLMDLYTALGAASAENMYAGMVCRTDLTKISLLAMFKARYVQLLSRAFILLRRASQLADL